MPTTPDEDDTYILHVRMLKSKDPTISRVLCVPADLDFRDFHLVLQAAFGWAEAHRYRFTVSEPRPAGEEHDRRFIRENKDLLSIEDFDEGWDYQDAMMVQMAHYTGRPEPPHVPRALASERTLASVFANPQFTDGKAEVVYAYDFGDDWKHEIVYLGKADGEFAKRQIGKGVVNGQKTWCVGGEGHPCAEDCGGRRGWKELKQAFADGAQGGERVDELRTWYKTHCLNGEREGLNPWKWDISEVNQRLAALHC